MLSDGMIIQRSTVFPVWSRKKIRVIFLGKTYEAQQADGKWLVNLEPVKTGGPYSMEIVSEQGIQKINDIYAGDVWLCAGQSNMELNMERLKDNYPEEWENDLPLIRQIKIHQTWDFTAPCENFTGGKWLAARSENLHEFSGTAFFFAKKMHEYYSKQSQTVPIGLVSTAWGGTPVEAWMSREALVDFPEKLAVAEQYSDPKLCKKITEKNLVEIQEWENNLWDEDSGLKQNWQDVQTNISAWDSINLPGNFSNSCLEGFCGVIWLARDFELSGEYTAHDMKVWLGTITDADTVFVNGNKVGSTGYRYPPRKYTVPAAQLKQGKNRIVIRVICNNGEGGITIEKPFRMFSKSCSLELAGSWKYKIGAHAPLRPTEFFFQRQPTGPYNAMIAPVLKFPLKGVIWYQGESNELNPCEYKSLFSLMIQDWRKKNQNDRLPFLFVQLPIFGNPSDNNEDSSWALLREAQAAALSLPVTGMAAALELGEWNDLHPLNKKDIGLRLFLAAEKILFNKENTSPGPMMRSFEQRQNKLFLFFDNCGRGLKADKGQAFASIIHDNGSTRIRAEIETPDSISIDISSIKNPKKVLYAWASNPKDRQLFNSDGLPVIPFRIEITSCTE